jgi:hypothetical protein
MSATSGPLKLIIYSRPGGQAGGERLSVELSCFTLVWVRGALVTDLAFEEEEKASRRALGFPLTHIRVARCQSSASDSTKNTLRCTCRRLLSITEAREKCCTFKDNVSPNLPDMSRNICHRRAATFYSKDLESGNCTKLLPCRWKFILYAR